MVEEEEEEEEFLFLLPKDFDPRAMPTWLLPPPSAEILFRGPPNVGVSRQHQRQPLVSSDSSLSWETFVSWPPPERRRKRRERERNKNENLSANIRCAAFFLKRQSRAQKKVCLLLPTINALYVVNARVYAFMQFFLNKRASFTQCSS